MVSPAEPPVALGLAASQLRRMRRIVDAAAQLAAEGGFDGVRLRDVAIASDVALGTLYKYFRSKEDILLFALTEESQKLEADVRERPARGADPALRLTDFFARATRGLTRKPGFARAMIRAIAQGDPAMADKVAGFHLRMGRLIVATLRDEAPAEGDLTRPVGSEREQAVVTMLNHVWFAALVGWAGGLHPAKTVVDRMREASELLLSPIA